MLISTQYRETSCTNVKFWDEKNLTKDEYLSVSVSKT